QEDEVFDVEDSRRFIRTLQHAAQAAEVPGLIVRHGSFSDALKQVRTEAKLTEEFGEPLDTRHHTRGCDVQVHFVDLLPHFRRNGLTDGARIFTGGAQTREYRIRILRIEGQERDDVVLGGDAM